MLIIQKKVKKKKRKKRNGMGHVWDERSDLIVQSITFFPAKRHLLQITDIYSITLVFKLLFQLTVPGKKLKIKMYV